MRDAAVGGGEVGIVPGVPEAQRALSQVIADAEQEVDLAKASRRTPLLPGAALLGSPHESPSPAVGGAVAERAEQGPVDRRLLPALAVVEGRVELVALGASKVVGQVGEGRRLPPAVTMGPEPARRDVLAGYLDAHPDRLLSHRRPVASA